VLPSGGFLCGIYVEIVYVGLNLCRKGEGTVRVHAIKAYVGSRGVAALILNPLPVRLKVLLHALMDCVFSLALKFTDYTRKRSPLQEKKKKNHNN
jgi:hypothetical protein